MPRSSRRSKIHENEENNGNVEDLILETEKRLAAKMNLILESVETLASRVENMEKSLATVVDTQDKHKTEIKELQSALSLLAENQNSLLEEFEARDLRKNNIIISGMKEKTEGSVEERKQHDIELVKDIMKEIGAEDASCKHVLRIGRPQTDRPRLMKVICSDFDSKQKILQKARELRNNPLYNKVFINADLTPLQQRKQKALRDELKQRKQLGENVKIRYGKIVTLSENTKNFQHGF